MTPHDTPARVRLAPEGTNGTRKWLIATLTALMLGLSTWVGTTLLAHSMILARTELEISVLHEHDKTALEWLNRIEAKLDRLIEREERAE